MENDEEEAFVFRDSVYRIHIKIVLKKKLRIPTQKNVYKKDKKLYEHDVRLKKIKISVLDWFISNIRNFFKSALSHEKIDPYNY